jgi:hypothetical protein
VVDLKVEKIVHASANFEAGDPPPRPSDTPPVHEGNLEKVSGSKHTVSAIAFRKGITYFLVLCHQPFLVHQS